MFCMFVFLCHMFTITISNWIQDTANVNKDMSDILVAPNPMSLKCVETQIILRMWSQAESNSLFCWNHNQEYNCVQLDCYILAKSWNSPAPPLKSTQQAKFCL